MKAFRRILSSILTAAVFCTVFPSGVFAGTAVKQNITVGSGDEYDFSTVQAAVDSIKDVPTEKAPAVITIADGVYCEEVNITMPYVNLVSASGKAENVTIVYDKANGHEDSSKNFGTDKTATVTVAATATGFKAQNITIENSYNIDDTEREQVQAVAFVSAADKVVLDGCRLIGRQDTLYLKGASKGQQVYGSANSARVFVNNCFIEGTVDFIFGDATAFFNGCKINMAYYKNGGHFTAPNTTLFNLGYVFNDCVLTVDKEYTQELAEKIDLGRPWQSDGAYPNNGSESVYINCVLPELLSGKGFSLWDDNTVVNKIRFKEYNSVTGIAKNDRKPVSTDQRAEYVQQLTQEQAQAFNAYNVLKGNDGWNPADAQVSEEMVCDVTLDNYNISIPSEETYQLKTVVLPSNDSAALSYSSSDTAVAEVSSTGLITAHKEGKASITVTAENGISSYAVVTVTPKRTALPSINNMDIVCGSTIVPGQVIKAEYNYVLESDTAIDSAKIRWYAVKDNKQILIKEGVGDFFKSYEVQPKDIGYKIKLELLPATKTTYGEYNKAVSVVTKLEVTDGGRVFAQQLDRTAFNDSAAEQNWTVDNGWSIDRDGVHTFLVPDCTNGNAVLKNNNGYNWQNTAFEGRFRFNPDYTGFTSGGYFNIYSNMSSGGYYRLNFNRGSNTKSLKVALYKKPSADDEEVLLASDDKSLKNLIFQSAGEENQYFYVDFEKKDGKISASVRLEGTNSHALVMTANDTEPLGQGTIAIETSQTGILMVDCVSVESADNLKDTQKQRLVLIGDSTVKAYGDDNTIGGWGEYIVNYFNDDVQVINLAEAGMSSRSYINTGRFEKAMSEIQEGDYVFFQFGHNDQRDSNDETARVQYSVALGTPDEEGIYPAIPGKKTPTPKFLVDFYGNTEFPYADTFYPNESGTFKWYMQQYIDGIRAKGGIPVVITPVCRIFFDSDGKITPHFGDNDGYVTAAKQLAEENNIDCIDMFNITKSLYESYGVMTTQGLHNVKSDGSVDITHYNKFGANLIASKMADIIKEMDNPLSASVINSVTAVDKTKALKTANLFVVGGTGAAADTKNDYAVKSGGYGDYLSEYLSDKITVKNLAVSGKTAKSYIQTEEYKTFISSVGEGDYVVIGFGNGDGNAEDTEGFSASGGTREDGASFRYYLYNYYVKPAAEKKAVVIMMTPYCDRVFDADGKIVSQHKAYTDDVIAEVTESMSYFVNLDNASTEFYNLMGVEGSKVLNAYDREKGICQNVLSEFGAKNTAKQILSNMKFSSASLKDYIIDTKLERSVYMTRGDYCEKVMNVLGITGKCTDNFADVVSGKSYENAIGNAKTLGFVTGRNGMFVPEMSLTADLIKEMTENALKYAGKTADFSNVYKLAGTGNVSNEIGLYAVDVLYEELNK